MTNNTQKVGGPRERFQKWVLSTEHPVYGWLDGHWLRRGDDREGYANEYVQGLWVAFKAFAAPAEDVRAVVEEPVAVRDFANELLSAAYEGGAFDAGDIQDLAVKHGLLSIEPRAEACGESCRCSEYGFPTECLRKTSLLKSAQ